MPSLSFAVFAKVFVFDAFEAFKDAWDCGDAEATEGTEVEWEGEVGT